MTSDYMLDQWLRSSTCPASHQTWFIWTAAGLLAGYHHKAFACSTGEVLDPEKLPLYISMVNMLLSATASSLEEHRFFSDKVYIKFHLYSQHGLAHIIIAPQQHC